MSKRRLAGVLLTLIVIGAAGYWAWQRTSESNESVALSLYGNVDIRQVDLAFNAEGKIETVKVEEGDRVKAGDLLARLDSAFYDHAVEAAAARLAESEAQLRELERGSREQEIARARAAVDQAQAALEDTQATLQRRRRLFEQGHVSQETLDQAQRAYDEADARLRQRREELDLAVEGPREERIAAARAQLAFNRATLQLARERQDNTTLSAPADGTVLTRIHEPGATVGPTAPVLTLALRDPMRVRTYVGETNLGRLSPGMAVAIHSDSIPGKAYEGQVGFISPTAEFTPKTVQTPELRTALVYRVRIIVTNPDDRLRQGMPVTVTFQSETGADQDPASP